MKLIFIYGPPAVGKLTVAKIISEKTKIPVFHNHYTFDIGELLYPGDLKKGGVLATKLREVVFKSATKNNVNLIFTYVYGAGIDDKFVNRIVGAVNKGGGKVLFVKLETTVDELHKRVINPSRLGTQKIKSKEGLEKLIKNYKLFESILKSNSLEIDNTNTSPENTADQIIKHFKLL